LGSPAASGDLVNQIQDCADFLEVGGVRISHMHQINGGYAEIFAKCIFMSACCRWNEKDTADKMWTHFKVHFAEAHRQHKQMQGESAAYSGYHAENSAVGKTEDQMVKATLGALENLATATDNDRRVVATLTNANSRLAKKLEERSNYLKDIKALLKKERAGRKGQRTLNTLQYNYCWNHGYKVVNSHASQIT
jgi:hypothetical protein